jgi:4-hydroxybenzoate polyprenyltransferase
MVKRLNGIWRLTRFEEYVSFVIVTTLLGAAASRGSFGWILIGVVVANWLAVGFAFMINDVEDAPDDALNPAKVSRNPVSAGTLSPRIGRLLSFLVASIAAVLYATLGLGPFIAGSVCLLLAYLYSWRRIRLKAIPIADLIAHAAMLAGLQFLAAYWAFDGGPAWLWVFPLLTVLAISLYGQLFNELRDFDGDLKAGVTHTAHYIGPRATQGLMMVWLVIGVLAALITLFVVQLFPVWVVVLMIALTGILSWRRWSRRSRSQSTIKLHQAFQKPIEIATAISLTTWFTIPSVIALLSLVVTLPNTW